MIKRLKAVLIIAALSITFPALALSATAEKSAVVKTYGKLPLYFIENTGQIDKEVKYYEKGSGHSTFFTGSGVYLFLVKNIKTAPAGNSTAEDPGNHSAPNKVTRSEFIKLSFLDANKNPRITAEGLQEGKVNYFIGNNPEKWRSSVPVFSAVEYKEVYKGIDIRFYGNNKNLEYDLIVSPGADPKTARLAYSGIEGLRVTGNGELEILLKEGRIIQKRPYVYQEIEGKRKIIEGSFRIKEKKSSGKEKVFEYGFDVASYDREYPLVIDPVLIYSTYLGGSAWEKSFAIAVDSAGNAYVTGESISGDFPTASAYQGSIAGDYDVFVTKINAAGTGLMYSTYLGGSVRDGAFAIAVDSTGNAYVAGYTGSTDFPTTSAYQGSIAGDYDVFVTKINAAGTGLVYSTYLGGSARDSGKAIAVDMAGNAYAAGYTYSTDFPTASAYQGSHGGAYDAFVAKLNAAGTALVYSTYLGGNDRDLGYDIALDTVGNAYVAGYTGSTDFPTASAYQGSHGGVYDAFVAKLNAAGTDLVYSTFLGGGSLDVSYGIALDGAGNAYAAGYTYSTDFPTASAYQGSYGGAYDAFVAKLNAAGTGLVYSTYLGGTDRDIGYDIALDNAGNAYVTGETVSIDFPTALAYQGSRAGEYDVFVTKLNAAGTALVYSTYLGGSNMDVGHGIALDGAGNAYVTGNSESTNFPVVSAYQLNNAGASDVFITKISNNSLDTDNDGILDDGDHSGTAGDNLCIGSNTVECDDNCIDMPNSNQADADNDGIGDICDACPLNPPAKIVGASYYSMLQAAYDYAISGDTIQCQDITYIENLTFDKNLDITVECGYDCDYTSITGRGIFQGNITLSNGTVTIENVVLE